ncbi:alpha/beta hydrolase [Algoriphagus sp.]|uniref:alpha/beta hydrolase n=1 Tax=Algoriphagus sp. TaxID=1872435 RepID=UPI002600BE98|nr:alpha/beta hydrolase [Algoriphagus sp.]
MKKRIQFKFEAIYSISHEPNFSESEVWILFHGYGQLAEYFIRKFLPFDSEDRIFLAPEGTNYSYLKDFQGRVGANWMTSYERELAIENNHRYLDKMVNEFLSGYKVFPKINVLGFSQGAATATRWASRWSGSIDNLILWAGGFAHDLNINKSREQFEKTEMTIILGDQDEFITSETIQKQGEFVKSFGKEAKIINFSGGHFIDSEVLKGLFK